MPVLEKWWTLPDHRDIVGLHRIVVAPQRFRPKKDRRHPHQTDALKKTKRHCNQHAAPGWLLATLRMVLHQDWCWEPLPQDYLPQVPTRPDGRTHTGDLRSTSWFRKFHVRGIINSFAGSERKKCSARTQAFRCPARLRNMAWERERKGVIEQDDRCCKMEHTERT